MTTCSHCGASGARDRSGDPFDCGEPVCDRCYSSARAEADPVHCLDCGNRVSHDEPLVYGGGDNVWHRDGCPSE